MIYFSVFESRLQAPGPAYGNPQGAPSIPYLFLSFLCEMLEYQILVTSAGDLQSEKLVFESELYPLFTT